MRVGIVGGGASGVATAWLLDPAHEVTLFERAPMLGGHVRTLGGNVPCAALPRGLHLDAGVVEYDRASFHAFGALMSAIGQEVAELTRGGGTRLFLADGRRLCSPVEIPIDHPRLADRLVEWRHLVPIALRRRRFLRRLDRATRGDLERAPIDGYLGVDDFSTWVRCLLMYAYSTPYDEVAHLSAAMAAPMLRDLLRASRWTYLPRGAWAWIDRAVASLRGRVHVGAEVRRVRREGRGVAVVDVEGHEAGFDAVVVAVPPHRVLGLLEDASDDERAWFGDARGGSIVTLVHTDTGPYDRRGVRDPSEFDVFELASGTHGYNAYLDGLAGLPADHPVRYGLAFDLEEEIDPAKVIHRQPHDVAFYTDRALAHRDELRRRNGERSTFYAGAYLGDGLHEGAIRSALDVAARLGGRTLAGVPEARA